MPRFLWQIDNWPTFLWDDGALLNPLSRVRFAQGRLFGVLETVGLGEDIRIEAEALIEEAVKTSEIEGEKLSMDSVRSSVLVAWAWRPADFPGRSAMSRGLSTSSWMPVPAATNPSAPSG
jgi:Fic family protein